MEIGEVNETLLNQIETQDLMNILTEGIEYLQDSKIRSLVLQYRVPLINIQRKCCNN